nr:FecR domain-containing protein [Comamonas koreensis]
MDESVLDELPAADFEALRWSVRVSEGLNSEARSEFEGWLKESPAHRAAYEDIAGVWDAIGEIPPSGHAHIRANLAIGYAAQSAANTAVANTAAESVGDRSPLLEAEFPAQHVSSLATSEDAHQHKTPLIERRSAVRVLAGIATLGILGGSGWRGWNHWTSQPVFTRKYVTERGFQQSVELPDGSSLQLDTATTADVTLFRNRREVRLLEGQVFFHVQGDRARPFDVYAGSARVTVVGTKFSVRYVPSLGDTRVRVAVVEGKVRVASLPNVDSSDVTSDATLVPGQAVSITREGEIGSIEQVSTDSVATWRKRRLSFDARPLAEVLAEIGRYGDLGVSVKDPVVGRLPVTVSVDLRNTNAFVFALPKVLPVRLVQREGGVDIVNIHR